MLPSKAQSVREDRMLTPLFTCSFREAEFSVPFPMALRAAEICLVFLVKAGISRKNHHQQQRQRRDEIAEQRRKLVAGEHLAVAAEQTMVRAKIRPRTAP